MDRKIILSVLGAALFAFIGIWLLLSALPDERAALRLYPWDLALDADGRVQVFDLTIGASTLAEVRALVGQDGKVTLFSEPDGRFAVEAYFDDVMLGNLRADWVVTLAVPDAVLAAMYERGLRVSKLGSGSRKVTLDPDDVTQLTTMPMQSLTYLPWKRLEPADLIGRFGEPAQRLEAANGVVHWLYPQQGLEIARDPRGGVVMQYLDPARFDRVLAPLLAAPKAAGADAPPPPAADRATPTQSSPAQSLPPLPVTDDLPTPAPDRIVD